MKITVLALLLASVCCAQAPQVPVTGGLGAGGVFPTINSPAVVFNMDADHTMSYPEVSGSSGVLIVTSSVSLTATRNMVAPLMTGFQWAIKNATSGGQSIQVIGSSGSGVTIPNGQTALVFCDGTNYVSVVGAVYPGSGVASSTGSGWGTSYQVGTSANNLVQLNSSAALPAVSGANLTSLNGASLQASTVGNSALANNSITVNTIPCTLGGSCTISGATGYSLGGTLNNGNLTTYGALGTGGGATVVGADGNHVLQLTPGTSPGTGNLVSVAFTASRGRTTYCTLSNAGTASIAGLYIYSPASSSLYVLATTATLTPSTVYTLNVSCP